MYFHKFPTWLQ